MIRLKEFLTTLKQSWNTRIFFQSILVLIVYIIYIYIGFIYAGLGMSRRYANVVDFMSNIPLFLVFPTFYIYAIKTNLNIKTTTLILRAFLIGMVLIFLIDLLIWFN